MSFETIEENRRDWGQEMVLLEILIGLRVHANKTIFLWWCFLSSVGLMVQKKRNGSGWFSEKLGSGTRRRRNAWGRRCPVTRVRPRGRHFVGPVGLGRLGRHFRHSQASSVGGKETAAAVVLEEEGEENGHMAIVANPLLFAVAAAE